ncbi:MAG: PEP-utilizing enzyme [candidate division KSB1 bacterium]|nr:PEP-utilizing enzyme [candidate division KSB1 bacterium]
MQSARRVVRIVDGDEPDALNPAIVGTKAAHLAKLRRAGLSVPAFVVLVTQQAKPSNSLTDERILEPLGAKLRAWGKKTPLAIRSSATLEDLPGMSLAGQFRSRLDIVDELELLASVKECLGAADSARVRSYLAQRGISALPDLHLIVQQMVGRRWSGVALTARGAIGRACVLIEASRGGSATVTSGAGCELRLAYTRRPGASPRVVALVCSQPAEVPGTHEEQELWLELGDLALKASEVLEIDGASLDVEWAWDGQQLWILQARAAQPPPLPGWLREPPEHIWTNFFFVERFLHPISTLGHSLLGPLVEQRAFREPLRYLGYAELAQAELTRLVAGRVLTRWDVFRTLHEILPPELLAPEKSLILFPDGLPQMGLGQRVGKVVRAAVRVTRDPDWLPWSNLRRWHLFVRDYVPQVRELGRRIRSSRSPMDLFRAVEKAEQLTRELLGHHRWSLTFAELFERLLLWLLKSGLGFTEREAAQLSSALLAGDPRNLTLQMHDFLAKLHRSTGEERERLRAEFVRRFGHRSASLDIAEPTWAEQADVAQRLPDPGTELAAGLRVRREGEMSVIQRLRSVRWPRRTLLAALIRQVLRYAREFAVLRENQRYYWHLVLAGTRSAVLRIGEFLTQQGILSARDDVFQLTRDELRQLCAGLLPYPESEFRERIEVRRREREVGRAWVPPSLVTESELQAEVTAEGPTPPGVQVLRGIGVSSGRATGRAFHLYDYDLGRVPQGSVLIMPGLDPGWTPVLSNIVGLVTESGGVLSHGAILAREFGVPAVASVAGALRLIRPGQRVRLDGATGTVEILPDAIADPPDGAQAGSAGKR